jgi:ATP adenylyltransferase
MFAPMIPQGELWRRVDEVTQRALACGALHSIPTDATELEDSGVRFLVRVVANLARKPSAGASPSGPPRNPFLPYDEDLFVGALSDSHVALLNKFNVVERHLLMVTRSFVAQETELALADFEAARRVLREAPALVFYNSGAEAGASQPHRHLQAVPLPLFPGMRSAFPLAATYEAAVIAAQSNNSERSPLCRGTAPFEHRVSGLRVFEVSAPEWAAAALAAYQGALGELKLKRASSTPKPYNLLLTRELMVVVPRGREHFSGISLNALGFAGALLVRDEALLRAVQQHGPLSILQHVTQAE